MPVHGDGQAAGLRAIEPEPAGLGVIDEAGLDADVEELDQLVGIERVEEAHLADQPLAVAGKVDAEVSERQQHGTREVAEFVHDTDGTQQT